MQMMLRRRVAVTSLLIALPAAAILTFAVDRARMGDMRLALDRVVRSQLNDQVRERCISDPKWFLTGPLIGRPPNGVFVETTPDALEPRPKITPQPFELFAYDEAFIGSSSASARFPTEFRNALRAAPDAVSGAYVTDAGTGVQMALPTAWMNTPCMYFLGRMAPPPHQMRTRVLTFLGFFAVCFVVALLATVQTVGRVRRLAGVMRESIAGGYSSIAPEKKKDELSSLTFMFNDAATELHLRKTRIEDQDEGLRRFIQATEDEVARPLAALEARLGDMELQKVVSADALRTALRETHDLNAQVENLAAASRLRSVGTIPTTRVDLNAVIDRVVSRHRAVAHAVGVSLQLSLPAAPVTIQADESLVERALSNVVDNAIRYNRAGGLVTVSLSRVEQESRFRLWVTDNGRGVTEEEFRGLTAVRRFRGDEGRNRRPGAPGLGLAVAQEVADRFKMKLDLKRPGTGGFEVEFSGAA